MQNQQLELDLLLQRVGEIISQADQRNKQKIEQQSSEVSEEWATLVSDLESRRDTLTKLSQIWETFEGRWQNFESLLTTIEEKVKHIDTVVRNKQYVIETKKYIEVTLTFKPFLCIKLTYGFICFRNCNRKQNPWNVLKKK